MTEKFNPEKVKNFNTRPLGEVSNFVVSDLPSVLEGIREGRTSVESFSQTTARLVSSLRVALVLYALQNEQQRDLAGLDLKMLETAIVQSGGKPSVELSSLIDSFSAKSSQPPGITYEEIILVNPKQDRRLFTRGEAGQTENAFYQGHRIIEDHLGNAVVVFKNAISDLTIYGLKKVGKASRNLLEVQADLNSVIRGTHTIGNQNRAHFTEFRKYLGGNPIRGTKGPSGAFTAGIPAIELFLAGEKLPQDYIDYLNENMMYFPRQGRSDLKIGMSFAEKGFTLTALSDKLGNPELLRQAIDGFSKLIRIFRGEHYKTVGNQLPEALAGKVGGTGGEKDPGTFLRERMRIRHIK